MAASTNRTMLCASVGYQPADSSTRRYDAPAARNVTRYDAPSNGSTCRLDAPASRVTQFRAPAARSGSTRTASAARCLAEINA